MKSVSYYDVAEDDLLYLEYSIGTIDGAPVFNNFLIQEQQICEKMLKELVRRFIFTNNVESILKSHKLVTLVNAIQSETNWQLNLNDGDLRFLSDFYFDERYPSIDYLSATKADALRGYNIVKDVVAATEKMLAEYKQEVKRLHSFDQTK